MLLLVNDTAASQSRHVFINIFTHVLKKRKKKNVNYVWNFVSSKVQIQMSQSLTLEQLNKSKNIQITEALNITECGKNCCSLLKECHIAIWQNTTCYNVECDSLDECHLSESSFNDTVQTVLVREFTRRSLNGTCLVNNKTTETETATDVVETTILPWTSTVKTPGTTSTVQYIRHLAIHISPTYIRPTIPEVKSNITAIVAPNPESGTIEGSNEKILKLSQLPPGNYTFRITVKSQKILLEKLLKILLDGSKSRAFDDIGIHKWLWTRLKGPNTAVLVGNGEAQVNVTGLKKGMYVFQLTAWDDSGVNGFDNVSVSVLQNDLGIQSWLWTRKPESLAAGAIIANSDRTSSSMLTNLVPGKYVFRLTVTDTQGLSDHDVATLIIHSNPRELDVVAITLRSDPRSFTDRELTAIREQIALLLHQQGSVNININIDDVMIEPKSGHGVCDQFTRQCNCQSFWMENPISVSNGADYNCDWSLVNVVIIVVILVILFVLTFGFLVYLCRKGVLPCKQCCPKKRRRLHRYSLSADPEIIRMTHKESGEEYFYTWAIGQLLATPKINNRSGTIEGSNEKILKLSQLPPGNYTFRITIKSQNSFGEALENLTVLAHLVPGNFTFCLTVTDSDGESNFTLASVEVIKETDYPPERWGTSCHLLASESGYFEWQQE
uniref:Dyslexia-associated protein n=1 Tax=Daphnia galeata TaxID=27404 RepID=A0A8J2RTL4_9CRUS|nr:unnamed protein product [Daphnia galeata]